MTRDELQHKAHAALTNVRRLIAELAPALLDHPTPEVRREMWALVLAERQARTEFESLMKEAA